MTRFVDPFRTLNFVDANILDDVADGQSTSVNEIVGLVRAGELLLHLPYSVRKELRRPETPDHVQRAADCFVFSIEVELTHQEKIRFIQFLHSTKGRAEEKNIRRDLFHVFEAAKYGAGYFLTRDKRLLARSPTITQQIQIEVLNPEAFIERVRRSRAGRAI